MRLSGQHHAIAAYTQRLRPLRSMPLVVRYLATLCLVGLCFAARMALQDLYAYPYLLFLPAIILAAVIFDRGSGFVATFASAALAGYFFVEPRTTFAFSDLGAALSVGLFVLLGLFLSALIEALRNTVEALAKSHRQIVESARAARQTADLLETVLESVPDPVYVKDLDGRFVRINSAMAAKVGAPKHLVVGNRDRDFLPADLAEHIEAVDARVVAGKRPVTVEEKFAIGGSGEQRCFLLTRAPWHDSSGAVVGTVGIARDIEERKRTEEALRIANAERELLLSDINHRVKNHLQAVVAMLTLSRRRLADEGARQALDDAAKRLGVLARVYDRLQLRGPGATVVEAGEFLESLCSDLGPTLVGLRPIAVRVSVGRAELDSSRAVSLGLLLNEAMTNALKHAFPGEREGEVIVRFGRQGESYVLEVCDDGAGRPAQETVEGLGTAIMRSLARQLGGELEWRDCTPGTALYLRFPVTPPS